MKRIIAGLIVKDVETAKAFYARHLGAKVVFDCGWYVTLRLGGASGPEVSFMTPRTGGGTRQSTMPWERPSAFESSEVPIATGVLMPLQRVRSGGLFSGSIDGEGGRDGEALEARHRRADRRVHSR